MNDRKKEPVKYAVALDYDAEKDPLPVILAKGEGDMARRMVEAAREEKLKRLREAHELAGKFFQLKQLVLSPLQHGQEM